MQVILYGFCCLFIVLAHKDNVVGVAYVESVECRYLAVELIQNDVCQPRRYGAPLLYALVGAYILAQACVVVDVAVVIFPQQCDYRRFSVPLFNPVECTVYVLSSYCVELFVYIEFASHDIAAAAVAECGDASGQPADNISHARSLLVGEAAGVHHFGRIAHKPFVYYIQ